MTPGLAAVLITWQQVWPSVGRFFVEAPAALPIIILPLALTALLSSGGYALLRRAEV